MTFMTFSFILGACPLDAVFAPVQRIYMHAELYELLDISFTRIAFCWLTRNIL